MNNSVKAGQPGKNCLHGEESSRLSEISLTCVEVRFHVGGMNPFSYKPLVFAK